jgi:putative glycerol-1-phosphate prenyltransferase
MTTAEYVSNTSPIPYNKPEIAATTGFAGQLLGMKMIYLDGGSGADKTVDTKMVEMLKSWIDIPLIVGGGIKTTEQASDLAKAGADVLVIGTSAEKNPNFLRELKAKMK